MQSGASGAGPRRCCPRGPPRNDRTRALCATARAAGSERCPAELSEEGCTRQDGVARGGCRRAPPRRPAHSPAPQRRPSLPVAAMGAASGRGATVFAPLTADLGPNAAPRAPGISPLFGTRCCDTAAAVAATLPLRGPRSSALPRGLPSRSGWPGQDTPHPAARPPIPARRDRARPHRFMQAARALALRLAHATRCLASAPAPTHRALAGPRHLTRLVARAPAASQAPPRAPRPPSPPPPAGSAAPPQSPAPRRPAAAAAPPPRPALACPAPRAPRHPHAPPPAGPPGPGGRGGAGARGALGPGAPGAMSTSSGSAGSGPAPVPLKAVVQAAVRGLGAGGPPAAACARRNAPCAPRPPSARPRARAAHALLTPPPPPPASNPPQVRRWFEDTLIEAQRGDVKQQALVAQMYAEGYGCERDLKAAAEWAERARLRGYKMKVRRGVVGSWSSAGQASGGERRRKAAFSALRAVGCSFWAPAPAPGVKASQQAPNPRPVPPLCRQGVYCEL
jgi:hypothetical protein